MNRLWKWWLREWDYLLIAASALILALLAGGVISATIDAIQRATVYH